MGHIPQVSDNELYELFKKQEQLPDHNMKLGVPKQNLKMKNKKTVNEFINRQ